MQGSPISKSVNCVLVADKQSRTLHFPTQVLKNTKGKNIYTQTFIDHRADLNCIDFDFIKWNHLQKQCLRKPLPVNNVDQTPNSAGGIKYSTTLFIQIAEIVHEVPFHVMNCGRENLILGIPWLKEVNPTINWKLGTININESTDVTENLNKANQSTHIPPWDK